MDNLNIKELSKQYLAEVQKSKINHFFACNFYAWLRKQNIEVTKEVKKAFRDFIALCKSKNIIKTAKTEYKSTKVYLFFRNVTLTIRKYTRKIAQPVLEAKEHWKNLYDELKRLYDNRAKEFNLGKRQLLMHKIFNADFTGCGSPQLTKTCAEIMAK